MAKRIIGALLLLLVGISAMLAVWYVVPKMQEAFHGHTSRKIEN